MMVRFDSDFALREVVYHRLNSQRRGMITAITLTANEALVYWVTWGDNVQDTKHYAAELSREPVGEFAPQ